MRLVKWIRKDLNQTLPGILMPKGSERSLIYKKVFNPHNLGLGAEHVAVASGPSLDRLERVALGS